MSYKWRKPLLVMYHDNYKYGTGLYVPVVNSLDTRHREFPYIPMSPIVSAPPRLPLMEYDLYAPISFGYGRSLLKKRQPANQQPGKSRISSRYYPFYYGMEGL